MGWAWKKFYDLLKNVGDLKSEARVGGLPPPLLKFFFFFFCLEKGKWFGAGKNWTPLGKQNGNTPRF